MQSKIINTDKAKKEISEWGTFRDSLKAPVHSWFTYPAGFSYKAVEHTIKKENLVVGKDTIYDPFMGSGTTNLVARSMGINSVGVEAHPFVYTITKAKLDIDINEIDINESVKKIKVELENSLFPKDQESFFKKEFPELIMKCFLPETLFDLLIIRNSIRNLKKPENVKNFLNTVLICSLRDVSIAATGWPYIAPNKIKITSMSKKGAEVYFKKVAKMFADIEILKKSGSVIKTKHNIILGDSRDTKKVIKTNSVDHIFTSPPYLNNFDYADRTRLEMYFMGAANNWADISNDIRTKLITSATTQISRTDKKYNFSESFIKECPAVYKFLSKAVLELAALRLIKGGKKSYDLLTVGYFNDLYAILKENFRVLKPGKKAIYILGDSAPYGVHIPTDLLIGDIGKCIGFKKYKVEILRLRGGKWANNPQRHSVPLRETIITLYK